MRLKCWLLALIVLLAGGHMLFAQTDLTPTAALCQEGTARTFQVGYRVEIPPHGGPLGLWLPVPRTTDVQIIRELRFDAPAPVSLTTGRRYGNRFAYLTLPASGDGQTVTMWFVCERREICLDTSMLDEDLPEDLSVYGPFLQPDALVVIDRRIRRMAVDIVRGRHGTLARARAIYDYVLDHMTYDKSGTGWGRGDTNFACDVGRGNCTDFHAMFNSLCRAVDIPSGFEIGLFLPMDTPRGENLTGYHCWAFFRLPGHSWIPVDISEADKHPELAGYYFGNLTADRVTLSTGRDIELNPPARGAPLNFFLYPYAENAAGEQVECTLRWSYEDR